MTTVNSRITHHFSKGRAYVRLFSLSLYAMVAMGLSLSVSCSRADFSDNDFVKYGLCAPAKSFRVRQIVCKSPCADSNFEVLFNSDGKTDSLVYLFPDGSRRVSEEYEYNAKGKLERICCRDIDGRDDGMYYYEYDGSFISSCTLYGVNNGELYRWDHTNDGHEIVASRFFEEKMFQNVTFSKFEGNVRNDEVFDADSNLVLKCRYEYYDQKNKLPLSIEGDDISVRLEYNGHGLPCKCTGALLTATGGLWLDAECGNDPTVRYEYEWDSYGNWTQRREYREDDTEPTEILEREIEY